MENKSLHAIENRVWDIDRLTKDEANIIRSVCPQATRAELVHFFHYCNQLKLNPLLKDIHFVKFGSAVPQIIIGIGGFRKVADRSGKHSGTERGVTKDGDGNVVQAWAKVHRSDWKIPAETVVDREEYDTRKNNWATKPGTMLMKVAEVQALRIAFPELLSNVYSEEERETIVTTSKVVDPERDQNIKTAVEGSSEDIEIRESKKPDNAAEKSKSEASEQVKPLAEGQKNKPEEKLAPKPESMPQSVKDQLDLMKRGDH